jgi:hypothetical protein
MVWIAGIGLLLIGIGALVTGNAGGIMIGLGIFSLFGFPTMLAGQTIRQGRLDCRS